LIVSTLCALVVVTAPLWIHLAGHDGLYHKNWIWQFTHQFRNGNWYPRWMSESFSGFGSPVFYFYPPLAYYAAGIISLLSITSTLALYHAVSIVFMVLSFFTARVYLRAITTNAAAATFGAFIYALTPYRIIDLYIRNAWTEYVALTWLPLIFLLVERLIAEDGRLSFARNTILMGGVIALTIVTNIPATIIIIPAAVVYMLFVAPSRLYGKVLLSSAISAVLGVLFAGIFTFPLAALRDHMRDDSLWQFFQTYVGYSLPGALGPNQRVFGFSLLLIVLLATWVGIVMLRLRKKSKDTLQRRRMTAFIVLLFGVVFLQIPLISEPVYLLPFFRYIQFAFRWDIVATIAFSSAVVIVLSIAPRKAYLIGSVLVVISALLIIAVKIRYGPVRHVSEHARTLEHDDPAEYLSIHVKRDPMVLERYYRHKSEFTYEIAGGFKADTPNITLLKRTPEEYSYAVSTSDTGTIAINLQHFVTWQVFRNGNAVPSTYDDYGRRVIPISRGEYTLRVVRLPTDAEKYGLYATIAGLLIVAVTATIGHRKEKA